MTDKLHWGILATGRIAHAFAEGVQRSETGRLQAVASRSQAKADEMGAHFGIPNRHGSYEALLADPEVQAVYISTPHPQHAEWSVKAAEAGKHILCEKPACLNHADAMAVAEAVHEAGVVYMEAFMYRCHPQTIELVRLLREGAIGEIRLIQAAFSFAAGFNPESRIYNNALGGGGILDVGCYPVSMARLIAGVALGRPFADPLEVAGQGRLHPETGVDEVAIADLAFEGGLLAQVSTGVSINQENVVRIYGTEGRIVLPSPWQPVIHGGIWSFQIFEKGRPEPRTISGTEQRPLYGVEADLFARSLPHREPLHPGMTIEDTLGNMRTLDRWRRAIGLTYENEKPENPWPTVHRRPLKPGARGTMPTLTPEGWDKPVSRFVMGADNQQSLPHAAVMFDDFVERGGNAFDTAFIYGGGLQEKLLGAWCRSRGLRDHVFIIAKGAHAPHCNPGKLSEQLLISLERLQTDYADLYLMHRDNPEIPVGEFVDVLNEHVSAGRIRRFGGSNWSLARIAEANAYAKAKGLQGFACVSNNFSLARMVDPVWGGCLAASDPDSIAWLKERQMPHFAWSSQARGFFTDRAGPAETSDPQLVRCWYSEDNFKRRERAITLAAHKEVNPINIAAAYVLSQPFPSFCLIGPRVLEETRTSMPALDILPLSPEECAWLNLESETRPF
ncbi:MAG: oxidoreductase [Puniceicoccaceae bacterium]|nr:MAG: oxidoreductase [Puniceicoccaceae bacterium]